jgi:hypothetical protein
MAMWLIFYGYFNSEKDLKHPGPAIPARPTFRVEKVALFCNPASGGTFSSTAIEIIKWVNFFAVAQAKVSYILRPGSA